MERAFWRSEWEVVMTIHNIFIFILAPIEQRKKKSGYRRFLWKDGQVLREIDAPEINIKTPPSRQHIAKTRTVLLLHQDPINKTAPSRFYDWNSQATVSLSMSLFFLWLGLPSGKPSSPPVRDPIRAWICNKVANANWRLLDVLRYHCWFLLFSWSITLGSRKLLRNS